MVPLKGVEKEVNIQARNSKNCCGFYCKIYNE